MNYRRIPTLLLASALLLAAWGCRQGCVNQDALEAVTGYGTLRFGDTLAEVQQQFGSPVQTQKDGEFDVYFWRLTNDPLCRELSAAVAGGDIGVVNIDCKIKDGFSINDIVSSLTDKYGVPENVSGARVWQGVKKDVIFSVSPEHALHVAYVDKELTTKAQADHRNGIKSNL